MAYEKWVLMQHPDHGKDAPAVPACQEAYDEVWADKGWTIVGDTDVPAVAGTVLVETDAQPSKKKGA